jgi:hypothetical protein
MTTMLDAALEYTERGWPVFPCRADKKPMIDEWQLAATTDRAQIRKWWDKWPKANIAMHVGDAGMMVLDYDPGSDKAELERNVGKLPATKLIAETPRGGTHEYYALGDGEVVPNSASKLAQNVDVRSFHGYVLLPPSRTSDGAYAWVDEGRPAYRSDELRRLAATARDKSSDRDNWIIEPDLPENVERCIKWLREDARISVEGQGGDANAYATAAMCKSFGISQEMAFDLMWEHWNPRCSPPWHADDADHLESKVTNGYSYNTSPPGNLTVSYRVARAAEGFRPRERELPSGRELEAGRFRFVDRAGMAHIQPASWLIRDCLTDGGQAIMFGASGTFKTFLALDMALNVACGFSVGSIWSGKVVRPGPVAIALGEGRPEITKRVRAWERLHYGGAQVKDLVIVDPVPSANPKGAENGEWQAFTEGLLDLHDEYALVIFDTVGRTMAGLNENAQEHASGYSLMTEYMRRELGCTTLGIAHSGHDHKDRERGSNVFGADADTRLMVERHDKDFVSRLKLVKQKDASDEIAPWLVKLAKVELEPAKDGKDAVASLAATVPDLDAVHTVDRAEARQAADKAMDDIAWTAIDNAVMAVLGHNRLTTWTGKALAVEVARQEGIDAEPKTIQNKLTRLAAMKETRAFRCFTSKPKPQWQWRTN